MSTSSQQTNQPDSIRSLACYTRLVRALYLDIRASDIDALQRRRRVIDPLRQEIVPLDGASSPF